MEFTRREALRSLLSGSLWADAQVSLAHYLPYPQVKSFNISMAAEERNMRVLGRALSLLFLTSLFAVGGCSTNNSSGDLNTIQRRGAEQAKEDPLTLGVKQDQLRLAKGEQADRKALAATVELQSVSLRKLTGEVVLKLNTETAFKLTKTAATEFVLSIPDAKALPAASTPLVSTPGSGIRSARAVQDNKGVSVRMFVDEGIEVRAESSGDHIIVRKAEAGYVRAQLEEPKKEGASDEQALEAESSPAQEPTADADVADLSEGAPGGENLARQNPTGVQSSDGSKIYSGRLISLDLQDTDIDNALRIIAEVSNLNIISSEDAAGKVTLRLIDVPWDQALDVILKTNGLDQVTEGNVIRIAPIEKLRQEREALREAKRAAENLEDLSVRYLRVSYARVNDLLEHIEGVLSERGTVTADDRTNQIIVKDIRKGQEDALQLTKKLDLRTPQVLLETQIVEASTSIMRDLGFQWNFSYVEAAKTGNPTGFVFPNAVTVGGSTAGAIPSITNPSTNSALDVLGAGGGLVNFPAAISATSGGSAISAVLDSADGTRALSARLTALEGEGLVKVISRPQVATVNNREATIKSVTTLRVPVPSSGTSIATGSGASAAGGGGAFEEFDVGIELTVTPQASPDYYVLLDVNAKSSSFGDAGNAVGGIPPTLEREATSTILVKSGQTFALGGIYRLQDSDSINGVPFLKDIPFLGHLFRRSNISKSNEELIFFITPHIVEGSFDPSLM